MYGLQYGDIEITLKNSDKAEWRQQHGVKCEMVFSAVIQWSELDHDDELW